MAWGVWVDAGVVVLLNQDGQDVYDAQDNNNDNNQSKSRNSTCPCRLDQHHMQAEIKSICCSDGRSLDEYRPEVWDDFCTSVCLSVGPKDEPGEEQFYFSVCTPKYLARMCESETIVFGCYKVIVNEYDPEAIQNRIEKYIRTCSGKTWEEVAEKISRIAQSEFLDYRES